MMPRKEGQVSRVFLLTSSVTVEPSRISSQVAKRTNDRFYMLLWESEQGGALFIFYAVLFNAVLTQIAFAQSALPYHGLRATAFHVIALHGATIHMSEAPTCSTIVSKRKR